MIKFIWKFFTKTSLTFWLLILIFTTLTTGSFYSKFDYHFFDLLNNNRVINWFVDYGFSEFYKSWWLLLLFILMALLAFNTFACTTERIINLTKRKKELNKRSFFTLLCPSLIHIAFILTLCGHLITYLTIEHVRYPIQLNDVITLPNHEEIKITDIKAFNYDNSTYLKDRLRDAEVTVQSLSDQDKRLYKIKFLDPVYTGNYFFHIDVAKNKEVFKTPDPGTTVCNRAEVKKTEKILPQFFLLYTYDPGLKIVMVFIFIIFILMIWFYLNTRKTQKA
ncbi:MAG: hypothetical protein JW864_05415 [Spirochaetes bacterium]|nr:hypothetical protein [Spirochaetota bacterium]